MLSGVPGYEFLDYSDGNNNVPTKNEGIEYKINKIKESPLSVAESFLYAE